MSRIQTKRTNLRRFRLSDLPSMILLESDPEVMKFTPARFPLAPEVSQTRLKALVEKENTYAPLGVWAAELKDGGEFFGWFMLLKRDFDFPELGFMSVKKHWGMGLTTEVAQALIDYAFKDLELKGLCALTDPDHTVSIHILEKLGFRFHKTVSQMDRVLEKEISLNLYLLRP